VPKLVCVKCQVELKPEHNGVKVVELFQRNEAIYKIWDADKWRCPKCGIEIVAGFGAQPLMERFEGDTGAFVEELRKKGDEIVYDKEVLNENN